MARKDHAASLQYNIDYYQAHLEAKRKYHREYGRANRAKMQIGIRRRRYGLENDRYEAMLAAQYNRCAICQEVFVKTPQVDHIDGPDGKPIVRGLLCFLCNAGLGKFRDNTAAMARAIPYVERWIV